MPHSLMRHGLFLRACSCVKWTPDITPLYLYHPPARTRCIVPIPEQVRRDLASKKGLDKPVKKLTKQEIDKRKAKLDEEASVRHRISLLVAKGTAALRVAVSLASAREGSFAALRIACVVPAVYSHAQSALLGRAAHDALLKIGKAIDPRMRSVSEAVVHSVLRASEATLAVPQEWMKADLADLITRTMRRLWAVTHDQEPLDVPSFGFCWPLLQVLLSWVL